MDCQISSTTGNLPLRQFSQRCSTVLLPRHYSSLFYIGQVVAAINLTLQNVLQSLLIIKTRPSQNVFQAITHDISNPLRYQRSSSRITMQLKLILITVLSGAVMASAAAIPQVDPAAPAPALTESHAVTDSQPSSDQRWATPSHILIG